MHETRPCVICLDRPKLVRFRPCGHAPCCHLCVVKLAQAGGALLCPLDKARVERLEWPRLEPPDQLARSPLTGEVASWTQGPKPAGDESGDYGDFLTAMAANERGDAQLTSAVASAMRQVGGGHGPGAPA